MKKEYCNGSEVSILRGGVRGGADSYRVVIIQDRG